MSKRKFYTYILRKPDGSPFYVGKGQRRRALLHEAEARRGSNRNPAMLETITAILAGGDRVVVDIVRRFTKESSALSLERNLIAEIGRAPNGPLVNLTDGGDGPTGFVFSEESRKAMAKAAVGRIKSPAHRKNISDGLARSAAFAEYKKKPLAPETIAKIVAKNTGRKRSDETKAKIAAGNSRRSRLSPESRAKIAASVARYYEEKRRA